MAFTKGALDGLLACCDTVDVSGTLVTSRAAPPTTELANLAQRRLQAAVEELVPDTVSTVDSGPQHGDPAEVLLSASVDADMLFLGSRGRGRVHTALIGSVSAHCIEEASCPVVW